jgi:hypothetical protein
MVVDRNHIVLYVLSLAPGPVNQFRAGTPEIQTCPNQVFSIGRLGQHLLKTNQRSGCIKPGPPTHAERKIMEQHPIVGERICEPSRAFRQVLRVIRHHHEKMDGSGYPYGLKANETSTVPRVTTVDVSLRSEQADEPLIRQTY